MRGKGGPQRGVLHARWKRGPRGKRGGACNIGEGSAGEGVRGRAARKGSAFSGAAGEGVRGCGRAAGEGVRVFGRRGIRVTSHGALPFPLVDVFSRPPSPVRVSSLPRSRGPSRTFYAIMCKRNEIIENLLTMDLTPESRDDFIESANCKILYFSGRCTALLNR